MQEVTGSSPVSPTKTPSAAPRRGHRLRRSHASTPADRKYLPFHRANRIPGTLRAIELRTTSGATDHRNLLRGLELPIGGSTFGASRPRLRLATLPKVRCGRLPCDL